RRTGRSRTLRWMLGRVGVIDRATADRHGLTGPAARHLGDASARLTGWLDEIGRALARADDPAPLDGADGPRGPIGRWPSAAVLAVLPELLEGAELSEAGLAVASLDPDLEQFAVLAGVAGEGGDARLGRCGASARTGRTDLLGRGDGRGLPHRRRS